MSTAQVTIQEIKIWWANLENREEIEKAINQAIIDGMHLAELEPLGLDEKLCNALERIGISSVGELVTSDFEKISSNGNYIGPTNLWTIVKALAQLPNLEEKKEEYLRSLAPYYDDLPKFKKFGR